MSKQIKKPVTLTKTLTAIAHEISAAIIEADQLQGRIHSLSATLGTLTRKAGKAPGMNEARINAFADACRDACVNAGLAADSVKVYLSNIRGVLRAMLKQGYDPVDGETLRNMYDQRPRDESKKTGAQTVKKESKAKADNTVEIELTPEQSREAAIRFLFKSYDAELDDAVRYAAANQISFMRWVKANVEAAALNEADKALTAQPAPAKRATKRAAKKAA